LATVARRLYPPPVAREPLGVWHAADPAKGRRLAAVDLRNGSRVAALASWHFEGSRQGRRPHLITSAAVRAGVVGQVRAEYLTALWLLMCVTLAIDARTHRRGEVGLVADNAIELDACGLSQMGFTRGRRRAGYSGDYWVLRLNPR
jgi:hypothetical protein